MAVSQILGWIARCLFVIFSLSLAYAYRLHAINKYGLVIHEFDPYFNYRATEYLAQHGLGSFFKWFDHRSWYPLGRPVGTTIYPGMQMTSVAIWQVLEALGQPMSLNDVCCYVPVWGGVLATALLGGFTYECSKSANAAAASMFIMAIVPAHMMRSVGGGYDNESVAMSAMVATFYVWVRSLRSESSWPFGALAAVCYVYMVAAWGGYIFVLNMIALHVVVLIALGRFSRKLHLSYSLFYVIGTIGAIQVPVVGWAPLKSLEQLGACAVFVALQVLVICEKVRRERDMSPKQYRRFLLRASGGVMLGVFILCTFVVPRGYFGPISSRVRSLFLRHTRTGNPLVDSVAEHQPASSKAYYQYLHVICLYMPVGFGVLCMPKRTDAKLFLLSYAVVAYFFSAKMVRLILLLGPVASALGGVAVAAGLEWAAGVIVEKVRSMSAGPKSKKQREAEAKEAAEKHGKKGKSAAKAARLKHASRPKKGTVGAYLETEDGKKMKVLGAYATVAIISLQALSFHNYSHRLSHGLSHPSIMFHSGDIVVDDYREAYWWLRDNTAEDSRVLAWWDYGYQISAIANRTTIADGNTWNHEHIATLGRSLVSPEKEGHKIVRHLADYVLLWAGGGGDDLAKSPHMARITNSVYSSTCPKDPTCKAFGFKNYQDRIPKKMMRDSLLYKLHGHRQTKGVVADPELFEEAYTSKYNKVRIFKVLQVDEESKRWNADPANRVCDAPGSWYCTGQYPPALQALFVKWNKKAFRQLEDFNVQGDAESEEYHKAYMAAMAGSKPSKAGEAPKEL